MSAKKKTVFRTIRLTKELDDIIQKDTQESGIKASALINQIMKKYAEWDRQIMKFGFICISREVFESILGEVEDMRLENNVSLARISSLKLSRSICKGFSQRC